jgi:peptide subunit release factor 1 (eRF1)
MAKFFRIAQRNANGLAQHKGEVQLFLQQNKIDILLVSETHFIMKTHFQIPQCNTYYTNQPFKMSSTKEATNTEPNYNLIQIHFYNPYRGTISHGD